MSEDAEGPAPERLPVSVITGFLGSGKTTLLKALLPQPAMADTAVVINEFGEIGLDHLLVETSNEDTILMSSGCLCCTIRGDLIDTLRRLYKRRDKGEVPRFRRLVIETTGLADPAPILHTLISDPLLSHFYRLDGVITTVDAINAPDQLDRQFESVKQAAVADRIVLTKADLASADQLAALEARLRRLNPAAPILRVQHGQVAAEELLDAGLFNPALKSPDVAGWLRDEAYDGHDHHGHDHDHGHKVDHNIRSAFAHVIADAMTSVLAIAALAAGRWLGIVWLDPLMGVLGACVIFHWSTRLARDTGGILLDMEAGGDLARRIRSEVENAGDEVADLHVWRVGPGHYAAIVAIVTERTAHADEIRALLAERFPLAHLTVELRRPRST